MKNHPRIRHSKFKNTGFLFELLTRQITLDILNNNSRETAKGIVTECFGKKTQLAKELKLYNLLLQEKYGSEERAEKFIDTILKARKTLNEEKLSSEKYNLVKTIKESFEISKFLASPITNYKLLASIHKLFEANKHNILSVKDTFDAKYTLVEHISTKKVDKTSRESKLLESYTKQDNDVRLLTYKILVETFNKTYTNLNEQQKSLLRGYINNVNNSGNFVDYYKSELKNVVIELHTLHKEIPDVITKIKLRETINVLKKQKITKSITDGQVSALMMTYELIKEIRNVKK